jgi:hypothetical protein
MTSRPAPAPPALPTSGGLAPSREQLVQLERELELYLAFWAHARDERAISFEQVGR